MSKEKIEKIELFLKMGMPIGWGFAIVIVKPATECDGMHEYISNLERGDAIELLKETADQLEGGDCYDVRAT